MSQNISALPTNNSVQTTDVMVIEQAAGTRKISIANLILTFVSNAWSLVTTGANATVPVYQGAAANGISASGYANIDIAITPKGTGAVMTTLPDNIAAGGNKRGNYAVDWQLRRTLASQVASGVGATICGGENNIAGGIDGFVGGGQGNSQGTGQYAVVVGGQSNVSADHYSFIGGGQSNTMPVTGQYSVIAGGHLNTIAAQKAVISGGDSNQCDGTSSFIPGGQDATTRTLGGCGAYSAGAFSVKGDNQWRDAMYTKSTANATPVNMHTQQQSSDGLTAQLCVPINSSMTFIIELNVKNAANQSAFFEIKGLLQVGATLASTALVGSPTGTTALFQDAGLTGITVAITANTSIGSFNLVLTGLAATTIHWVARIRTVENVF